MAKISLQQVSGSGFQDFSIEANDREFLVLAGPSGCGNCAALRVIAGLEAIEKGEIVIGGKPVADLEPKDRDIAMVFQHDTLYPRMTVRENMEFALKLRKFPEAEIRRRIAEATEILELGQVLDRKPAALSAAERFHAGLGRAIVRQPKAFLFEDPLANLDPALAGRMRSEISRIHQRLQATMIYATHDPVEAMTMGERIVVMREGVIQQTGVPVELYREPDNLPVAMFLGAPPMNFVTGKLREAGDALVFKEAGEGILEIKFTGRPEARPFAGRDVIAGIRPEDIQIVTGAARPGIQRYKALLDIAEPMGAETHAHIETGAHKLLARTSSAIGHEDAGHRVQFEIDPAAIHLFDPETTRRIAGTAAFGTTN